MSAHDKFHGTWVESEATNKEAFFAARFEFLPADKKQVMQQKLGSGKKMSLTLEKNPGGGGNITLKLGDDVLGKHEGIKPGTETEIMTPMGFKMKGMMTPKDNGIQIKETDPNGGVSVVDFTLQDDTTAKAVHTFGEVSATIILKKQ